MSEELFKNHNTVGLEGSKITNFNQIIEFKD